MRLLKKSVFFFVVFAGIVVCRIIFILVNTTLVKRQWNKKSIAICRKKYNIHGKFYFPIVDSPSKSYSLYSHNSPSDASVKFVSKVDPNQYFDILSQTLCTRYPADQQLKTVEQELQEHNNARKFNLVRDTKTQRILRLYVPTCNWSKLTEAPIKKPVTRGSLFNFYGHIANRADTNEIVPNAFFQCNAQLNTAKVSHSTSVSAHNRMTLQICPTAHVFSPQAQGCIVKMSKRK